MKIKNTESLKICFKEEFDRSSASKGGRKVSFSVPNLVKLKIAKNKEFKTIFNYLFERFKDNKKATAISHKILNGLIRFSFLCQPVNDDCTTTLFMYRWDMKQNDSRYASLSECIELFNYCSQLIFKILEDGSKDEIDSLILYMDNPSCPYDLPFDYKVLDIKKIHAISNVEFYSSHVYGPYLQKRMRLKKFLKPVLPKKILDKINVSAYKTERSQTGDYQSNREYRWETVANSPQGANKKTCWDVEIKLLEQVCRMDGFPVNLKAHDEINYLLKMPVTQCPVMLLPLSFKSLIKEAIHGESEIQLGHISPKSNMANAHSAQNISWISSEGNRIQGDNSIRDIHKSIIELSMRIKSQK